MSHLTTAGAPRSAPEGVSPGVGGGGGWGRLGLGVPGYAHPLLAPAEWAGLTRPGAPLHWVVLNVAGGPGDRPDPHCLAAAGRLNNAGVRVLGHLDLAQGERPFGEVITDAQRYLEWYRVGGFLLDRAPVERAALAAVRRTTATLEAVLEGGFLVLGHGSHPYPGYAEAADQLVTFSGPWTEYRWSQAAPWTADHPPERFAHFVHGVPRTRLERAIRIARWQGAGTVFFTDRTDRTDRLGGGTGRIGGRADRVGGPGRPLGGPDRPESQKVRIGPYETLPGYWDEIVSRIGPGVSE
ncbi:spherulation-specific family 4 protein [Streptomyces katsurahamanus]|uniref:Phage tail protein n=1 Tax=Streptomyces katsurahamanus TaxID=2577098 RepID=A0ABW9NQJ6_9ACTN|nr:phage tail protein [Streptomyces katsurahamanus]